MTGGCAACRPAGVLSTAQPMTSARDGGWRTQSARIVTHSAPRQGTAGFEVFRRVWANRPNLPAIVVLFVSGLAHPAFLIEMDAIAVVPQ